MPEAKIRELNERERDQVTALGSLPWKIVPIEIDSEDVLILGVVEGVSETGIPNIIPIARLLSEEEETAIKEQT